MSDPRKMYSAVREEPFPEEMSLRLGDQELRFKKRLWNIDGKKRGLRYGENPDQPAALYELTAGRLELGGALFRGPGQGLVAALKENDLIQAGKHPGKINLTDVDNGLNILQYLAERPAAVILKHNNPCGAAWDKNSPLRALEKAYWSDRIAAFGGAVVLNRPVDKACAEFLASSYFEVLAAPEYEQGAVELLKNRKNLRIMRIPGLAELERLAAAPFLDIKSLLDGGLILQFSFQNRLRSPEDFIAAKAEKDGQIITARAPSRSEAEDLIFAWAVEAGVTSNSVIFAKDGATTAIGTGEQDRVGCVELAIHKAHTKFSDRLAFQAKGLSLYELSAKADAEPALAEFLAEIEAQTKAERAGLPGSALVSDGFFPFRDGVDIALAQGVTAIAQPGGSIRDFEIIEAVNQAAPQAAMVFTGQRAFNH